MNIGIITFHSAHNYGAMLQAFALQKYIKNTYNCNVKNINFITDKDIKAYKIFKKHKKIHSYIWEILKFLHFRELKKRHNSFESFLNDYIDTTERYPTYKQQNVALGLETKEYSDAMKKFIKDIKAQSTKLEKDVTKTSDDFIVGE